MSLAEGYMGVHCMSLNFSVGAKLELELKVGGERIGVAWQVFLGLRPLPTRRYPALLSRLSSHSPAWPVQPGPLGAGLLSPPAQFLLLLEPLGELRIKRGQISGEGAGVEKQPGDFGRPLQPLPQPQLVRGHQLCS